MIRAFIRGMREHRCPFSTYYPSRRQSRAYDLAGHWRTD